MAIKLIKACKELNIGMATLTAWCEKHGHAIESDPNVRIDDDLYLLLAKEFNKDQAMKIETLCWERSTFPEIEDRRRRG